MVRTIDFQTLVYPICFWKAPFRFQGSSTSEFAPVIACRNVMVSDISMVLVQDLARTLCILDWFQEAAKTCCISLTIFFSASAGAHSNSTDIKRARRRNPNRFLRCRSWFGWHLPVSRLPHLNTKVQQQTMSPPVQNNSGLFPSLVEYVSNG